MNWVRKHFDWAHTNIDSKWHSFFVLPSQYVKRHSWHRLGIRFFFLQTHVIEAKEVDDIKCCIYVPYELKKCWWMHIHVEIERLEKHTSTAAGLWRAKRYEPNEGHPSLLLEAKQVYQLEVAPYHNPRGCPDFLRTITAGNQRSLLSLLPLRGRLRQKTH